MLKLGFSEKEVKPFLDNVEKEIYSSKIEKYINKKAKSNKKSINEFKRKTLTELLNKGFAKGDITLFLDNIEMSENKEEMLKIINKLYQKYIKKYDITTTKLKIKQHLYQKGYRDIDTYLDNL